MESGTNGELPEDIKPFEPDLDLSDMETLVSKTPMFEEPKEESHQDTDLVSGPVDWTE